MKGFIVEIDFSQTDKSYVFVEGAKTREKAVEAVKERTSCPRVYAWHRIDAVFKI